MENAFIVQGGTPLRGTVEVAGAKNVATKVIVASLLFNAPVSFSNIPNIEDVRELLHLLELLGCSFVFKNGFLTIDPTHLNSVEVDLLHGSKIRTSFLLFAPLLHRFKKAIIPNPGGCRLGKRPIDRHIKMLKSFGAHVDYNSKTGYYTAFIGENGLSGIDFTFEKPTHTGTDLALLMGVQAQGKSVIRNSAQEPEVDDLISFLNNSGGDIKRDGKTIYINGVADLQTPREPYHILYDELEAVTYGVFALATHGDIEIKRVNSEHLQYFSEKVKEIGGGVETTKTGIRYYYKDTLKACDITTSIYPGFRTDWQAQWAVLMTQATGTSTIHETVFENKFGYVEELMKLGAKIECFQPNVEDPEKVYQFNTCDVEADDLCQGIKIKGPTVLHNGVLRAHDIRAGATVLIAGLTATGESVIQDAIMIDRGYEKIEEKLESLGAHIKRV